LANAEPEEELDEEEEEVDVSFDPVSPGPETGNATTAVEDDDEEEELEGPATADEAVLRFPIFRAKKS